MVAFLIYCLLFTLIPKAMGVIIPWLRNYFRDEYIYIVLVACTIAGITLAFNVIMWFIYVKKIPFF